MTDFDTKLAELEDEANRGRVPELKMVVELLRMQRDHVMVVEAQLATAANMITALTDRLVALERQSDMSGACMDPTHHYTQMDDMCRVVCATCRRPKMPKF